MTTSRLCTSRLCTYIHSHVSLSKHMRTLERGGEEGGGGGRGRGQGQVGLTFNTEDSQRHLLSKFLDQHVKPC